MKEEEQIQKREREEYCRKHGGFFDQYGNWREGE
jgi:hypothetical protein